MPTASIAELRKKGVRSQSANGRIAYRPLVGLAHSAKSRRRRSISRRTDLVRAAFDTEGDMAGLTTLSETRTASIRSALATESPANSTVGEPTQLNTALEGVVSV